MLSFLTLIEPVFAQTANPAAANSSEGWWTTVVDATTKIMIVVLIFVVAMLMARFIAYRILEAVKKNHSDEEHKEMLVLVNRLVYITFACIGISFGLGITNMFGQLGWLLGAIGLGIGFSLQTLIGNFVAGLALLMQRKIRIGDYVEMNLMRGIITNIGSRTTTLHDFDGTDILIPNLEFFTKYVRIYTANTYRRIFIEIGVGYDTDFAQAYQKVFEVLKHYPEVEQEPPPDILCDQIKSSTVSLMVRWWIRSNLPWWKLQSNILQEVFVELQKIGVDISFPVQTLRVDAHQSKALYQAIQKLPPA